jgi:hypothetical protein
MKRFFLPVLILMLPVVLFWQSCSKENQAPVALFTIEPAAGNDETIFVMDAAGTSDPDDDPESLLVSWDWEGDGKFDTQYATRKKGDHKYSKPGDYSVTLVVKDPRGLTDTLKVPLSVSSSNLPPEAPFNPDPANGAVTLTVNPWMKWSSSDPDGDPLFFTCFSAKQTHPPNSLPARCLDPSARANSIMAPRITGGYASGIPREISPRVRYGVSRLTTCIS